MSEFNAPARLITPSYVIPFNQDLTNGWWYFITDLTDLDGAPVRAPTEDASQTDGGLTHDFLQGPRHPTVTGILVPPQQRLAPGIMVAQRNQIFADLRRAVREIKNRDGVWEWTDTGMPTYQLTVRGEMPA